MALDEDLFLDLVLTFLWGRFLWIRYLAYRQSKTYRTHNEIPDVLSGYMNPESFEKARLYGLAKLKANLLFDTYEIIFLTLILHFKLLYVVWTFCEKIAALIFNVVPRESEIIVSSVYLVLSLVFACLFLIPVILYLTFVVEAKFGLNKKTVGEVIIDLIRGMLIIFLTMLPIYAALMYIIHKKISVPFVWGGLFITVCFITLINVYQVLIAPMLNISYPLPEGSLKTAIDQLASDVGFPLSQVNIVEVAYEQAGHSNAYSTGLFRQKRIVLYDTLLEKYDEETEQTTGCNEREVVSIVAHEIGHWKNNDNLKILALAELYLTLGFVLFWYFINYSVMYRALGFPAGYKPVLIGLLAVAELILPPYITFFDVLSNAMSRHNELEADRFAASIINPDTLLSALTKITQDNLDFPFYDKLYAFWHLSQPTLMERIENLR